MSDNLKKIILNSLKIQSEIFGDEIFEKDFESSFNFESKSKQINSVEEVVIKKNKEIKKTSKPFLEDEKIEFEQNIEMPDTMYDFSHVKNLQSFEKEISVCQNCSLGKSRTNFVFGIGNPNADIMLIGEAPGAEEDKQGIPFVGRAGKLLTEILKAINFTREEIYIANILKCRPPNNRDPLPEERETCMPYLFKQIDLIKPKLILCVGKIAANTLLGTNDSLTKMREKVHDFHGVKLMVTYHPAALLRNPHWKRPVWEDVQKFRKLYDKMIQNV